MFYQKLTNDLKISDKLASEAIKNMSDGGSANLDRIFLTIPRRKESKVLEAIEKAGLYCSGKVNWIGSGFMITPNGVGQGITRAKAVEVMYEKLKELGWDVMIFHMLD